MARMRKKPYFPGERINVQLPEKISSEALTLLNEQKYTSNLIIRLIESEAEKIYGKK
ncbi:MAG: hypothetical protein N4A40_12675 [Tissierellales bacterium]|jgi:hypothetical protein|nr:hypothetical protein [Tissierellales bacterium]